MESRDVCGGLKTTRSVLSCFETDGLTTFPPGGREERDREAEDILAGERTFVLRADEEVEEIACAPDEEETGNSAGAPPDGDGEAEEGGGGGGFILAEAAMLNSEGKKRKSDDCAEDRYVERHQQGCPYKRIFSSQDSGRRRKNTTRS